MRWEDLHRAEGIDGRGRFVCFLPHHVDPRPPGDANFCSAPSLAALRRPAPSGGHIFLCVKKDMEDRHTKGACGASSQAPYPSSCPLGQELAHSAAPPLPTKPASLGFGGDPFCWIPRTLYAAYAFHVGESDFTNSHWYTARILTRGRHACGTASAPFVPTALPRLNNVVQSTHRSRHEQGGISGAPLARSFPSFCRCRKGAAGGRWLLHRGKSTPVGDRGLT